MSDTQNKVIEIYTEYTPNPESLKFVANKMLTMDRVLEYRSKESAEASPLALELFDMPFVDGVFISGNFVTITKTTDVEWVEVIPEVRAFLKKYLEEDKLVWDESKHVEPTYGADKDRTEIEQQIIDVLDKYVKPAVEMDGGNIEFKSYHEGRVTLIMQGSCSGCPSSTITLKTGIEGLLKKMMPNDVAEVVANMG